jgi:hypothetical protein
MTRVDATAGVNATVGIWVDQPASQFVSSQFVAVLSEVIGPSSGVKLHSVQGFLRVRTRVMVVLSAPSTLVLATLTSGIRNDVALGKPWTMKVNAISADVVAVTDILPPLSEGSVITIAGSGRFPVAMFAYPIAAAVIVLLVLVVEVGLFHGNSV